MADLDDGQGFKGGFEPYGAVGMKEIWYGRRLDRINIGTVLQASLYGSYKDTQGTETVTVKNLWDVNVGVGLQWRAARRFVVYGGPFFYYGSAEVTTETGPLSASDTFKYKDFVGAFAGGRYSIGRRAEIGFEGRYNGGFCGSVSVGYSFED